MALTELLQPDALQLALGLGLPYRHVRCKTEQDVLVLQITHNLLVEDVVADGFGQELLAIVTHAGTDKVVLDFHDVKCICSKALEPLCDLRDFLKDKGGSLVLCGLTPNVAETFHVIGLTGVIETPFPMEADVASAVASAIDR